MWTRVRLAMFFVLACTSPVMRSSSGIQKVFFFFTSACIPIFLHTYGLSIPVLIPIYDFRKVMLGIDECQYMLPEDTPYKGYPHFYLSHPGQQCRTSCTNTSHSVQKSFKQSVHRYRPKGLITSAPVSIAVPAAPLAEFESEFPFVAEVLPLALSELFLPGPESVVGWNVLEHA